MTPDLGYVAVDAKTLREAIERAEADACSCVVSHAKSAWHARFWAAVDAKQATTATVLPMRMRTVR